MVAKICHFVTFFSFIDPCGNYTELSSPTRSRYFYNPTSYSCDYYNLTVGWYRFTGPAGSSIATSCVGTYRCGGLYTSWMSGNHPYVQGAVSYANFCFARYGYCCYNSYSMLVKNCGNYFVYRFDYWIRYYCNRVCGNGTGM